VPLHAPLASMPRRLADLTDFVCAKNVRRTFFALMRRIARSRTFGCDGGSQRGRGLPETHRQPARLQIFNSAETSRQCALPSWQYDVATRRKKAQGTACIAARTTTRLSASVGCEGLMTKVENRCANCGGKFGLVSHQHWGLRFCCKACKDNFLARSSRDRACVRKWFGFLGRATS
jgi:hypothetical protein